MDPVVYSIIAFLIAGGGCIVLHRLTKNKLYVFLLAVYTNLIGLTGILFLIIKIFSTLNL